MQPTHPKTTYQDLGGHSGITHYDNLPGAMIVRFEDGWTYLYTVQSAGADNIRRMQSLATAGRGLCTFITRAVREQYERKWR